MFLFVWHNKTIKTREAKREVKQMKEVLYESEIFAQNVKTVLPFKIVIEMTTVGDKKELLVKRKEIKSVEGKKFEDENVLMMSFWKE